MKRDMDLIRELLIRLEAMPMEPGSVYQIDWDDEFFDFTEFERNTSVQHFKLLLDAGFISGPARQGTKYFVVTGLSWNGHEFIDSIRNPEVWNKTKAGVKTVGGLGLDLVVELAKAEGKRLITEKLGIFL